jgi:hypothetical protein
MLKSKIQLIRDTVPSFLFKLPNGAFTDNVRGLQEEVSQNSISYELAVFIDLDNSRVMTEDLVIHTYYYGEDDDRIYFMEMGVDNDTTKEELLEGFLLEFSELRGSLVIQDIN